MGATAVADALPLEDMEMEGILLQAPGELRLDVLTRDGRRAPSGRRPSGLLVPPAAALQHAVPEALEVGRPDRAPVQAKDLVHGRPKGAFFIRVPWKGL